MFVHIFGFNFLDAGINTVTNKMDTSLQTMKKNRA